MRAAILAILCLFMGAVLVSDVGASGEDGAADPWLGGMVKILSKQTQYGIANSYVCDGNRATIFVEGNGQFNNVCVFGTTNGRQFARFSNGSVYLYAVSFPNEQNFHEVRGVCGYARCVYSPASDTIIMHTGIAPSGVGAVVYKHFSSQLVRHFDVAKSAFYFQFQSDAGPDYVVKAENKYLPVEAIGVSSNGRWAVLELKDYGIMRLDINTLEARRIKAPGATYGLGHDPTLELAISNDGRDVAITGRQSGISIISVDNYCGDRLVSTIQFGYEPSIIACKTANIDFYGLFPNFNYAGIPRFDSSGEHLGITVNYQYGPADRVILVGPNYSGSEDKLGYLALGDSFTSGEGEVSDSYYQPMSNVAPFKCHVSVRSYPYLIGADWDVQNRSVACSGARTVDILGADSYAGQANSLLQVDASMRGNLKDSALRSFTSGILAQSEFVSVYQPSLVSVGIGGNDAGLVGKLMSCLNINTCEWASDASKKYATSQEIAAVYPKLVEVIRRIKSLSPSTQILMVGYPNIIDASQDAVCDPLTDALLNHDERVFINQTIHYLDMIVEAAALTQNVVFADVENAFQGHELCGQYDEAAMNGVRLGDDIAPIKALPVFRAFGKESFHPTPTGHQLVANAILASYQHPSSVNQCDLCSDSELIPPPPAYWLGGGETDVPGGYGGNEPVVHQVEDTSITTDTTLTGANIAINSQANMFDPASTVTAQLHSEVITLGSAVVEADGSVHLSVDIPSDFPAGYHVLHLTGTSMSGEPIDLYKTIAIESPPQSNQPDIIDTLPVVDTTSPNQTPDADSLNNSKGGSPDGDANNSNQAVLGAVKSLTNPSQSKSVSKNVSNYDSAITFMVVGPVLAAIIAGTVYRYLKIRRRSRYTDG